jgi:hypothetical protein
MQELIFITVGIACGISAFAFILKRYGSDCIP